MNKNTIYLCLMILVLSACKKNIYDFSQQEADELEIKEVEFEYLSAKMKVEYQDDKNDFKTSASLLMKKDSVIWFSMTKGPLEVSRGMFTKDSLVILDKVNKQYSVYNFEELSKEVDFELDFGLIQSAVLGNLIFPYDKENISRQGDYYDYKKRKGRFVIDNYIGTNSMKIEKLIVQDMETQHTLQVDYKNFQLVEEQLLPYEVFSTFNYFSKNTSTNKKTIVNITFNKVTIEKKPLRFSFRIPQRYERK
ncbi:MAG: DUF4292 domain-containing protein [Bacteroidota bacterium]